MIFHRKTKEYSFHYGRVKVTPVTKRNDSGPLWGFDAVCLALEEEHGSAEPNDNPEHGLFPIVNSRREAIALRRDFIALLKKHGWKEERTKK